MKETPQLLIHLDVDSPRKLLDFYQIKNIEYDQNSLDEFYRVAFDRAMGFFSDLGIFASFFVVGNELTSHSIKSTILQAHELGHEIENHTYSHPFGLANLSHDQREQEIVKCSEVIHQITGRKPIGFRSPGYSINTEIVNHLERLGFTYDSSGFWSIMNPVLKLSHKFLFKNGLKNEGFGHVTSDLPKFPYWPDQSNWLKASWTRSLIELPLPRTPFFQLPFYHNFNLWAPSVYSDLISKSIQRPYMVYLFHIIEFMDMQDSIPKELAVHPNLSRSVKTKLTQSKSIVNNLRKHYSFRKTQDFCSEFKKLANRVQ
ncbi:MAG: polysaccharide deacetylase family protein [Cyclobacteriaceae bacterium]|nr:polysaccharide deacetylase family protein [Cyclobacteriaceae bacterium]